MVTRGSAIHEDLAREGEIDAGSDRSFGVVFTVVFGLVAGSAWHAGSWLAPLWAGLASIFGLLAAFAPGTLSPANRAWAKVGIVLGRIVTPVVMGVIFFGVITPMALAARALGKDFLRLAWDRDAPSYWIPRDPPGPAPDTMRRQF